MKFERDLIFNLISIFIMVRLGVKISLFLGQVSIDVVDKYKDEKENKASELKDKVEDDIDIKKAVPAFEGKANGAIIIMLYTGYYRILSRNELSQRS